MWTQINNDCFLDSFLFATFATEKVSKNFIEILVAIKDIYKPLYDAFVGYLDLHTKSTFHSYNDCKQRFKNSIFNCLFKISREYKNDTNMDLYNNKLNECLEGQFNANIPYDQEYHTLVNIAARLPVGTNLDVVQRARFNELAADKANKNSTNYTFENMGDSNIDCLFNFFELVPLLISSITSKIYYKSSNSNYPNSTNPVPLKPFFELNYYDCIIYVQNQSIFSKTFYEIESDFNNNLSTLYEINSIIVPCGNHVVAFNTEMCANVQKYFFYNNMGNRSKVEIAGNVTLSRILSRISDCYNATIIATKKS